MSKFFFDIRGIDPCRDLIGLDFLRDDDAIGHCHAFAVSLRQERSWIPAGTTISVCDDAGFQVYEEQVRAKH
jgi:hypothetical protein